MNMQASERSTVLRQPKPPAPALAVAPAPPSTWFALFAGLSASLVAIGLARFAYTPLIPLLIQAHWFSASDVLYLGAANFAGYFVGALAGRPLARRFTNRWMLRAMMALASASFIACAVPLSLAWFFAWRFLSGLSGAVVMVLVAQTILPMVEEKRRGAASGAIFMGIGAGIIASGTLLPPLLHFGLQGTWIGLGLLCALLTALTWTAWPVALGAAAVHGAPPRAMPLSVRMLYAQYSLIAIGLVPAAVFLVDFIARGMQRGAAEGALFWILYGLGAMFGPLVFGALADRINYARALRLGLLLSSAAAALLAWLPLPAALIGASVLLGAFTPGVVTLMIGRLHELLPGEHAAQHAGWSQLTTMFALFQALSGYAFSYVFTASHGDYRVLFGGAAAALVTALALGALADALARSQRT
jgi:predicted MFS family arabinose efflux permease